MAQNFRNYLTPATGTSAVDALGGATNSIDCLISIRMANILTSTITVEAYIERGGTCLLYTSPSPRDGLLSRMPSYA